MKEFLLFFIINYITSVIYEYEPIEEIIPKSSILFVPEKSYKIYEYNSSCPAEEEYLNHNKSVYLFFYGEDYTFEGKFYIYDNYSKIEQDKSGKFINSIWEYNGLDFRYYILKNFTCNHMYYFVFLYTHGSKYPLEYQFIILEDKPNSTIPINPSLSDFYAFIEDTTHPLKLKYQYEKNIIALITLKHDMNLKIFENNILKYNEDTKKEGEIIKYKFIKNIEYNIIFKDINNPSTTYSKLVSLQFLEENKYVQHNFTQSPLILFDNYEYYIEIDLSKYSLGEYIIFYVFSNGYSFIMDYQYKNKFKQNNFTKLVNSLYIQNNFIPIKKIEDDNLILYIKIISDSPDYKSIDILNYKVEKVSSNITLEIKEPKVFYIDYYDFSEYNSFGIYSNQTFLFIEQIAGKKYQEPYIELQQIKIVKRELNCFNRRKIALIFFIVNNYSNESAIVEFKKFDYQIITDSGDNNLYPLVQYLQFGKDKDSPKEYYFYINYLYLDVFIPVYGSFESYFIPEERIKKLSDLDFTNQTINNDYSYKEKGYLKIKSNNKSSMIKHIFLKLYNHYYRYEELETGKIYYYLISNLLEENTPLRLKYDDDRNLSIKFRVYKLNSNESLIMTFNDENYTLNETPIEIHFEYKKYNPELIYFSGVNISRKTFIEIKIAFQQNDLNSYKQIDFKDSIGLLNETKHKNAIIKIPKNFTEDLCDYLMILFDDGIQASISYDTLEYAVPMMYNGMSVKNYQMIELFKDNPYSEEFNEPNKYFFITITRGLHIFIRKTKIFDGNLLFNKINKIPKLTGENTKFYYQIELPKTNSNYVIVQSNLNYYYNSNFKLPDFFSKYKNFYNNFISLMDEYSRLKYNFEIFHNSYKPLFIYILNTDIDNYINFVQQNEYFVNLLYYKYEIYHNISQIEGTSKIKINATSLSYHNYPNKYKYYLFINMDINEKENEKIFQLISGDLLVNEPQKLIILEDNGDNETLEYEEEINFELNSYNVPDFIIPVNKENNLIEFNALTTRKFKFNNIKETDKEKEQEQKPEPESYTTYYIIGAYCILILIVIIMIVVFCIKRKKNKGQIYEALTQNN